jgi:hypothetical protein
MSSPAEFLDLTQGEQEMLYLHTVGGLEYVELAKHLGTTLAALYTRMNRCAGRHGCPSAARLAMRYMIEYLGVGEPIPFKAERESVKVMRKAAGR